MSLIKVSNIFAGYGTRNVLEDISFEVNAGELVGVLGLNGSGKSTLVKSICSIIPHEGRVEIDGRIVEKMRSSEAAKCISYIPQRSGISIAISVLDVVMMGFNPQLKLLENPTSDMRARALQTIEMVGLKGKADVNFMHLSEGQKQLAILARALVADTMFFVMDEPESALDFRVRYELLDVVKSWIGKEKRAGLVILHDTALALDKCDRIILIKDKTVAGIIDLHADSMENIEEKLRLIYGNVSLAKVCGKSGIEKYAMLCE